MDILALVLLVMIFTLCIIMLFETRDYRRFRQEVANYTEIAAQFIVGFETIKSTVNFNADIQKETISKVNAHNKAIQSLTTMLEIHDRALSLKVVEDLNNLLGELVLQPKKEE